MTFRRIATGVALCATVIGIVLRVTGIDSEGNEWRGTSWYLLLGSIVLLIASDVMEGKRE